MVVEEVFNTIRDEVKAILAKEKGSHNWDHTKRVYNMCLHLAKQEDVDVFILRTAAILHDIGRAEQQRTKGKVCHAEYGATLAREILKKHALDQKTTDSIIHCIETHRSKGSKVPESPEAKVLFDADKLDAIGAVGIGRTFQFAGEYGARLHNHEVDLSTTNAYSEEDTAYREFTLTLSKIKDRMKTPTGKKLSENRHKFMIEFFDRLDKEVDGEL